MLVLLHNNSDSSGNINRYIDFKDKLWESNLLYLDCYSGISGDMFLGALVDAGLALTDLQAALARLPVKGFRLTARKVNRGGISGTLLQVITGDNLKDESNDINNNTGPFRNLTQITALYDRSSLPLPVKEKCIAVFRQLARIEAAVHGVTMEEVHFHEVGALDAIADITGVVVGLYILNIDEIICSPLPLGRGMVNCRHGILPLPAPATVKLLTERDVPVYGADIDAETVTPTGAALVTVLAERFGKIPSFNLKKTGYGAGSREFPFPNFLRVLLGSKENHNLKDNRELCREKTSIEVIETNIDDTSPEILGYVMNLLLEKGAADVYFTAIQMKKNRPAVKITVLSPPEISSALIKILFHETSTIGCRVFSAEKHILPRRVEIAETPWGEVRVKVTGTPPWVMDFSPEYEDCLRIARRENISLKDVYKAVEIAYANIKKN